MCLLAVRRHPAHVAGVVGTWDKVKTKGEWSPELGIKQNIPASPMSSAPASRGPEMSTPGTPRSRRSAFVEHEFQCPINRVRWLTSSLFICSGGGGSARSGIPNQILLCKADVPPRTSKGAKGSITPLCTYDTGRDLVQSFEVHPDKKHVIAVTSNRVLYLTIKTSSAGTDVFEIVRERSQQLTADYLPILEKHGPDAVSTIHTAITHGVGDTLAITYDTDMVLLTLPELRKRRPISTLTNLHSGKDIVGVALPNTEKVVTAGRDGTIRVWSMQTAVCEHCVQVPTGGYMYRCLLSLDHKRVCALYTDRRRSTGVQILSLHNEDPTKLTLHTKHRCLSAPCTLASISQNSSIMAVGINESDLQLIRVEIRDDSESASGSSGLGFRSRSSSRRALLASPGGSPHRAKSPVRRKSVQIIGGGNVMSRRTSISSTPGSGEDLNSSAEEASSVGTESDSEEPQPSRTVSTDGAQSSEVVELHPLERLTELHEFVLSAADVRGSRLITGSFDYTCTVRAIDPNFQPNTLVIGDMFLILLLLVVMGFVFYWSVVAI